jgi:hypothetical protein
VPGSAPKIGRLARIPGTGLPRAKDGKGKERSGLEEKGKWRQWRIRVRIAFFLVCFVCMLGFVLKLYRDKAASADESSPEVDEESRVRVVSKFPSPSENEALGVVRSGLAVRDPGNVEKFFQISEGRDQEVVDFLTAMASSEGSAAEYQWLSSVDANQLSLDGVSVIFKGKEKATSRVALLTPDDSGTWKIDFDAFARTVKPGWKSILDLATQVAVVRVIIVKESYFNGPFRDEKQWNCYGMASPDTDEVLMGYCKLNSPQEAALAEILSDGGSLKRVTLEIRRLESGEARQFEISQVIAEDWVVTDRMFQANFAESRLRLPDPVR